MMCSQNAETPTGKATTEDPKGSASLPRRLKRCPWKAEYFDGVSYYSLENIKKRTYSE
jgi:hypothetical protein